jgi:glucokinase
MLHFSATAGSILAVDLRLTEAYAAVVNLDGTILSASTHSLPAGNEDQSLDQLLMLLREAQREAHNIPPLRAVVIGAPSIVDPSSGQVEWAPSLGWKNVPLGRIVHEALNIPVRVENDVNLAALGETWRGIARGCRHTVFVSVGSGIGAGVILDGELYHGATNAAGEVAYFITDIDTLRDNAGQIGSLEMRVGRDGIIRLAHLLAQRYPASKLANLINLDGPDLPTQEVFALALEGDPAAQVVFRETVDLLTIVICNLSVVLDTEMVILGGPSDWKWATLVEAIRNRIGSALLHRVNLRASTLGRDALVLGAACLALGIQGVLLD